MLRFKPKTNDLLGEKYKDDTAALGYIAYDDNGNNCGTVVFYLDGYSMRIVSVEVPDSDPETQKRPELCRQQKRIYSLLRGGASTFGCFFARL